MWTRAPGSRRCEHADEVLAAIRRLPEDPHAYIIEEARESAWGMARWQMRGPVVKDEDDLDDYMFEVAGRVGHMLTRIFAWHYAPLRGLMDDLMPLAREFGLALQTVNVIRGLAKDYQRGWIFVPESFCARVGLKPPDLFKPENLEKSLAVVDMLADKAEGHLRAGWRTSSASPAVPPHPAGACGRPSSRCARWRSAATTRGAARRGEDLPAGGRADRGRRGRGAGRTAG